jgi:isopentenyl diphosphate isomerase/L-lactate dehydrogenase-like FMN-dependent dehydrogenase
VRPGWLGPPMTAPDASPRGNPFLRMLRAQLAADLRAAPRALRARSTAAGRAARCGSIAELREAARRTLPPTVFDFLEGGAVDEITMQQNLERLRGIVLAPRVLRGVETINLDVSLFGDAIPIPVVGAPTGGSMLFHTAGEVAVARALHAAGTIYVLSAMSSQTIEHVATEAPGRNWFQLYLWKDRGLVTDLVTRAADAHYEALVLTVDTPRVGQRERDRRNGFTVPPRVSARSLLGGVTRPRWSAGFVRAPEISLANLRTSPSSPAGPVNLNQYPFDAAATWADVAWLRERWSGPLLIKGILTPDDAAIAIQAGADGLIVSNHGGRQLDHAPATIDALPRIVAAAGTIPVLFDGGIRRGSDVFKALALGARACMLGRSLLYGLSVAGQAGVSRALELVAEEFELTMALMGCDSVVELHAGLLDARTVPSSDNGRALARQELAGLRDQPLA